MLCREAQCVEASASLASWLESFASASLASWLERIEMGVTIEDSSDDVSCTSYRGVRQGALAPRIRGCGFCCCQLGYDVR